MDPNGIADIGASFGDDLPVPDFSRLGRWAASRLTDAGELAGVCTVGFMTSQRPSQMRTC